MRARVQTTLRRGQDGAEWLAYLLEDAQAGSRFEVWPARGFLAASWQVTHPTTGRVCELIWTDPARPLIQQGIPILFPFPNRLRAGQFTWQGRSWSLPCNDPSGRHAIHGLVRDQNWRVARAGLTPDEQAEAVGHLASADLPPPLAGLWPAQYLVEVGYRIAGTQLEAFLAVTNTDTERLPFGFGLHPYWNFPAASTRIELAASGAEEWQLEDLIPTGTLLPLAINTNLLSPGGGLRLGDRDFDQLYRVAPPHQVRRIRWALHSPERGGALSMTTSPSFRDFVVFTPPHRAAVCVEPYTCVTDAINLHGTIWDKARLIVLDPGSTWRGWVRWEWNWT
ncbi:MAG TPA: aldose 1-epimerase [Gemmatales bacterium]|nr:aldose 1-epimerase [Gemmatales bacterium]HMP58823.1 aldose 1-epimerase [Gemmatales bacterium]